MLEKKESCKTSEELWEGGTELQTVLIALHLEANNKLEIILN